MSSQSNAMMTQRQGFMRYEMIDGYLWALCEMRRKKLKSMPMNTYTQKTEYEEADERLLWHKRKAMRARGLLKGGHHWAGPHGGRPRDGHNNKPHVINPAYVDADTAREALEAYYRATAHRKDAFLLKCPRHMHTMLYDDAFKLGVRPTEYLRGMDLHLTQEEFEGLISSTIDSVPLKNQLDQLFQGILKKKDFRLHITVIQSTLHLKQWDLLFPILVPFYHRFRAEGADVRVSWAYTRTGWYTEMLRCEYSLGYIMKEWKPKVIKFLDGEAEFPDWKRKYRTEDEEEEESPESA